MNRRDIDLMSCYAHAIESLIDAQSMTYSANGPEFIGKIVKDTVNAMTTDLAGHVDPTVKEHYYSDDVMSAYRSKFGCTALTCEKCTNTMCMVKCNLKWERPNKE